MWEFLFGNLPYLSSCCHWIFLNKMDITWDFKMSNLNKISKIIVCKRFEPLSLSIYNPPFYFFSDPPSHILTTIFIDNIIPMKHILNTKKLMMESYFMFKRLQNNIACFFCKKTFISNTRLRFDLK